MLSRAIKLGSKSGSKWRNGSCIVKREQKITLGEMRAPGVQGRASGIRGLLVYCADYKCAHSIAISADRWPDDVRLSDLEPHFVCKACGHRGADVRPDYDWEK